MTQGRQQTGFTLLEVMLVALLLGMVATTVVLTIPSTDPRQKLTREADRMIGLMQLAQDEAILSGRELGMEITETGYQLLYLDIEDMRWLPMNEKFAQLYELDEPITT